MLVQQILSSKSTGEVFTLSPSATLSEAAALLSEKRIGAIIVSKDGKHPAGILSERDIVRELGKQGPPCLDYLVSDLMTRDVTTVTPAETALDALNKMTAGRFRHLPVLDNGVMVGVISIGDVVKYRMDQIEHENEALTEMIVGHG